VKFENQPISHEYIFKNEGNTRVTVILVSSTPKGEGTKLDHDFTLKPVMPGEEGKVILSYSSDHPRAFDETATVKFSEDSTLTKNLRISGTVAGRK
jgi:hypothetical protein